MIKRFLSMDVEQRATIIIWLYERYVVAPALQELIEIGLESDVETEFYMEEVKPLIH